MVDWLDLSEWITPDLGVGAVVGAIIAGAVALHIDYRRRLDEGKSRFSEEKLRAYEEVIASLDTIGQILLLCGEFAPLFRKIKSGEVFSPSDLEEQGLLNERLEQITERYEAHDREETMLRLSLLSSGASTRASFRLMKVLLKMGAYFEAGNYEKVGKLALRYELASAGFLVAARSDLGIRG